AVPAGIGTGYFTDPAQAAREELLRVVVETLPVEAQTKLAESGRQRDQRALQSARLAVLAALDDALLLSTPQQQRMEALLDVVWDVPVATSENPFLGGPAASLGSAALLHEVRTLLPDAELPSIFRPRQLDQWKALGEAASQAQRNQPDQGGLRRGMILNRAALRPVRAGGQAAMLGEGSPSHLAVYQVSHAPAAVLELAVDDVAAACELSEDQRTKLLLAGGLDLKRMAPRPDAAAVQGAGVNLAAGLVGQVQIVKQKNRPAGRVVFQGPQGRLEADQVLMFGGLRQDKAVTASFSAYQKALGKLSDDQLQRLSVARHERRLLHQRATVAAVLHAIDERVLLSAEQHQRLSAFFKSQFAKEAGAASDDPQLETFKRLSRVSARDLEPMFDEAQWSIAAGLWQELCAAIRMPHAKPAE
ncbi:MAG TPA: hypothetical protein VFW87_15285, partial [Pirellulales bacterium]|nr:hypothetical protein [Pirellulales bacterium]